LESILLSISTDKRSISSTRPTIPSKKRSHKNNENHRDTILQPILKDNKLEQNAHQDKISLSKLTSANNTSLKGEKTKRKIVYTSIDNKSQSDCTWNHNHHSKINILNSMITHDDSTICSTIFEGLEFFLSREVPQELLRFVIWAFGGKVICENSKLHEIGNSTSNIFYVFDRPLQEHIHLTRQYIKPQWILDCVNFNFLVPTNLYGPKSVLPPHLSPFVNIEKDENSLDLANFYRVAKWRHLKHRSIKELENKSKEQVHFTRTYSQANKTCHTFNEKNNHKPIIEEACRGCKNDLSTDLQHATKTTVNEVFINENRSDCLDSYNQRLPLISPIISRKSRRLYKAINSSINPEFNK
jgi:hypothetical protein